MAKARGNGQSSNGEVGQPTRDEALHPRWAQEGDVLTTVNGVPVSDTDNSLKVGTRGPTLLEDFHLREKIMHFDHERIPERVVHARGAGAHGRFQLYRSLEDITCARVLCDPSVETPTFVRFSTVAGSRGSADTARDVRGFAVKFYTDEGIWDLVGNNIPVFFIQDGVKFPDIIHAAKPEPHWEIPQAQTAHDTFWDFVSLQPESTHMLMWAMSDRAIPRSYRTMQGFGVHTFRLVNEAGDTTLVKFHWRPAAGTHSLVWEESQKLGGIDPDFHRRDLWEAIDAGAGPGVRAEPPDLPRHARADVRGHRPARPHQARPRGAGPAAAHREDGPRPQPHQLLRRDRAGGVLHRPHPARPRVHRRPAAPGPQLLLPRHPADPPGRAQLRPAADQPAPLAGAHHPARRLRPAGHPRGPGAVQPQLGGRRVPVHRRRGGLRVGAPPGGGHQGAGAGGRARPRVVRRPLHPGHAVLEQHDVARARPHRRRLLLRAGPLRRPGGHRPDGGQPGQRRRRAVRAGGRQPRAGGAVGTPAADAGSSAGAVDRCRPRRGPSTAG